MKWGALESPANPRQAWIKYSGSWESNFSTRVQLFCRRNLLGIWRELEERGKWFLETESKNKSDAGVVQGPDEPAMAPETLLSHNYKSHAFQSTRTCDVLESTSCSSSLELSKSKVSTNIFNPPLSKLISLQIIRHKLVKMLQKPSRTSTADLNSGPGKWKKANFECFFEVSWSSLNHIALENFSGSNSPSRKITFAKFIKT